MSRAKDGLYLSVIVDGKVVDQVVLYHFDGAEPGTEASMTARAISSMVETLSGYISAYAMVKGLTRAWQGSVK